MGNILLGLLILAGSSAFAAQNYYCYEKDGGRLILKLDQIGSDKIVEGQKYKFNLELVENKKAILSSIVTVETEDVQFFFSAPGITGQIYLDELDQTYLEWNGTEYHFDCNEPELLQ